MATWARRDWADIAALALSRGARRGHLGPVLLAVDGRSGSGKTTVAGRLAECVPGAQVVHTDDVAWYESFFGWDHLLAAQVLRPLRQGQDIDFRPPAWQERGRRGSIRVSASAPLVVVEGVGSSRRSLTTVLDDALWVQSDFDEANRRGIERDGGTEEVVAFWAEWGRAEERFLAQDRPWDRAWATVCGTPELVVGGLRDREALVAGIDGHAIADQGPACRC